MATFNKFYSFVEAVAEGVHNFQTATFTLALTNTAPVNTNTVLANISQISYTNIQDGTTTGRNLTGVASSQTLGVYKLTANNIVLIATGAVPTFQYIVLYNNSATNDELIGWYDYGSPVNLVNGETFSILWSASGIVSLS